MSMVQKSINASDGDRTKASIDHDSVIALAFIVLVLICLSAVISMLGSPQDTGLLVGPA